MKEERIKQLENYISEQELCSLDQLCNVFNISKATLRRDLSVLESSGVIRKVYGGVATQKKEQTSTIPFGQREIKNHAGKDIIGRIASEFVSDGDTIFVDSGTTTLQMAEYIKDKHITILTNNLNLINQCSDYPNLNIISLGGQLLHVTNSFAGEIAVNTLQSLNISKAFMATTGITIEAGFTNSSHLETAVKKAAIAKSNSVYILADASKWGVVALMTYANLNEVSTIITDLKPPKKFGDYCKANNVSVLYQNR